MKSPELAGVPERRWFRRAARASYSLCPSFSMQELDLVKKELLVVWKALECVLDLVADAFQAIGESDVRIECSPWA